MDWVSAFEWDGFAVVPGAVAPEMVGGLIRAVDAIRPGETAREKGGRV